MVNQFIKRLNISPQEKENYSRYFLYNKSKESLKNMTGYLYLLSYLKDENERFKFLFSVICTYNKNMFYLS